MDIRFNGSVINKSMLQAAAAVHAKVDGPCRRVISQIEMKYGRDVISGGYFKIMRVVQFCEKQASDHDLDFPAALLFIFEGIWFALERKLHGPKHFTQEVLDRNKHDGHAGWLLVTLAKMWMYQHLLGIVDDMSTLMPQPGVVPELRRVLAWFESWSSFQTAFPPPADAPAAAAAPAAPAASAADMAAEADAAARAHMSLQLADMKMGLSKVGGLILELLYCTYAGLADVHIRATTSQGKQSVSLATLFCKGGFPCFLWHFGGFLKCPVMCDVVTWTCT